MPDEGLLLVELFGVKRLGGWGIDVGYGMAADCRMFSAAGVSAKRYKRMIA